MITAANLAKSQQGVRVWRQFSDDVNKGIGIAVDI